MKTMRLLLAIVLLAALSGCGPIYSSISKSSEGIQEFKVVKGNLSSLKPGGNLLVYGPFAKTGNAYYIAKGEDASQFNGRIAQAGFQKSELYLERNYKDLEQTAALMRQKSPAQLKADYNLDVEPATILFGTIVQRGPVTVMPFRAVMPETFRLEFFDVAAKTSTVVEVRVKMRYEEIVPSIVEEIMRRSGGA